MDTEKKQKQIEIQKQYVEALGNTIKAECTIYEQLDVIEKNTPRCNKLRNLFMEQQSVLHKLQNKN